MNISEDDEVEPVSVQPQPELCWSARHKPSTRLRESVQQGLLGRSSVLEEDRDEAEYSYQSAMNDPLAFAAQTSDPDTLRVDQAMRAPDRKQFLQAMVDEVEAHSVNKHWIVVPKGDVPISMKVLPCVWAMKRKRHIDTQEVYKWKARLNLHGGKQELGVNYWETYAATLSWPTIRFFLTLALINKWSTKQIDFTLAYPQANVECKLSMEIPRGFVMKEGGQDTHCLKVGEKCTA